MKKTKSAKRRPTAKRTVKKRVPVGKSAAKKTAGKKRAAKVVAKKRNATVPATVDQYFAAMSPSARMALKEIRDAIRSVVPAEATEIISYQIPAFKHKTVLVWYAAFADHYSLFPTASIIQQFKDELKDYSTSKGTIHFPADKPLPLALIKEMVK